MEVKSLHKIELIVKVEMTIKTKYNGKDPLAFLGPKIWELISRSLREYKNIQTND